MFWALCPIPLHDTLGPEHRGAKIPLRLPLVKAVRGRSNAIMVYVLPQGALRLLDVRRTLGVVSQTRHGPRVLELYCNMTWRKCGLLCVGEWRCEAVADVDAARMMSYRSRASSISCVALIRRKYSPPRRVSVQTSTGMEGLLGATGVEAGVLAEAKGKAESLYYVALEVGAGAAAVRDAYVGYGMCIVSSRHCSRMVPFAVAVKPRLCAF